MIKKIISIKSVGLFNNNSQDVDLKKFNIIYGENGRGKSTLSIILRSLCSGEPSHILERRTIDSANQPEVRLLLEPSIFTTFKDGKWNRILSNLEIFDSYFISNNIYSGNTIDIDQRRNLHQFVIGQDGVKNANAVSHCDKVLKSINNLISKYEGKIQQNISGTSVNVSKFVGLKHDSTSSVNIDDEIIAKRNEVDALKKGKEIIARPPLEYLSMPTIPRDRLEELLSKTLDDISKDAERITHEHIHGYLDQEGVNWIQTGFNYIRNDTCPFCGQRILENPLISAYQNYFDATYVSFKKEICDFSDEIRNNFSDDKLLTIQKTLTSNDLMIEFWKDYIPLEYNSLAFTDIQDIWNNVLSLIELTQLNLSTMNNKDILYIRELTRE